MYLINGLISIPKISVTSDEGSHIDYGLRFIQGDPNRYNAEKDNSKMPINILNTLPRVVEQLANTNLEKTDYGHSDAVNGRYITLLFSVLTILLIFIWATDLFGVNAGLFAAFLFSWCPNNLAAATLSTTDAYSSFFLTATLYFFYKYCNNINTRNFIYFSIFIALSQLAKQSLFHLYPLCLLSLIGYFIYNKTSINYKLVGTSVLIFGAINFLILNAGFLFNKMFIPIGQYHFMSNAFLDIQHTLPKNWVVPFTKAFVDGLDMVKYYNQIGGGRTGIIESSFGNVTILNHSSTGGSFWYFYFVSIWFKTPIPYFILFISALSISYRNKFANFKNSLFFLLLPAAYFIFTLNFFYNTQCGIRHIIFIYPLLIIFSSQLIIYLHSKWIKVATTLLCLWLIISVTIYKENCFAYTNEFILNKTYAYKKVGASNLNIGQAKYILRNYLNKNPSVTVAPVTPSIGTFVVSVDNYLNIWNDDKNKWLKNIEPIASIANGVYLIIKVTPQKLADVK